LGAEVYDVQDLCIKEVVYTVEVVVGGDVGLDIFLDLAELCDEETQAVEDDKYDMDAMVDMAF